MSKEQLNFILEISAQNPPPENAAPPQLREWFEMINSQTPIADGCTIERVAAGPLGGELITTANTDRSRVIIYYHGGGWFFGSTRSHRVITTNLARASGYAVLAASYRLAPENPAPAAHDDAYAVYEWALLQGYAASRIALAGDSAGGNLALSVAVRARQEGKPAPGALWLMSPALDLADEGVSHRSLADAPLLTPELMGLFNMAYLQGTDPKSPRVTPFYADLSGMPATLIHVGGWEILRDDSVTIAERMRKAGSDATVKVWDGMCHCWQLFAPMLDEGMQSIEEGAQFIRGKLV